jgi:hypothetical protein
MKLRCCLSALLLSACLGPALAQTIYRCPDGYSQAPCTDGSTVEAHDERSSDQQAQSAASARRDAKLAEQMERERLKQEAQPVSAYIPASRASVQAAPASGGKRAGRTTPAAPDVFRATAAGSGNGGKKAEKKRAKNS